MGFTGVICNPEIRGVIWAPTCYVCVLYLVSNSSFSMFGGTGCITFSMFEDKIEDPVTLASDAFRWEELGGMMNCRMGLEMG